MINGKIFFALAAQKLGSDKALPYLALDPALGAGARTVMSIKLLEDAEAQSATLSVAETKATTAEAKAAAAETRATEAEAQVTVAEAKVATAEEKTVQKETALSSMTAERDASVEQQALLQAKLNDADQSLNAARRDADQLRLDKEKLVRDVEELRSELENKSGNIRDLEKRVSEEERTASKVSKEVTSLQKKLVDAETKMAGLTGELDTVRESHAKLKSEFVTQDRAFTALANQFAGPDATEAERAEFEERLMTTFAKVPDEGPDALTDLFMELLLDQGGDEKFAEFQANFQEKLAARPELKAKIQAKYRAIEKEHIDRQKAFFEEVSAELDAIPTPRKPRSPRNRKG